MLRVHRLECRTSQNFKNVEGIIQPFHWCDCVKPWPPSLDDNQPPERESNPRTRECQTGIGVKIKSLCLTRHEDVGESGSIAPQIIYHGTRWRWVVSFILLLLYPMGKDSYGLSRRFCPSYSIYVAIYFIQKHLLVDCNCVWSYYGPRSIHGEPIFLLPLVATV
jgi:hypothetical protein